MRSSGARTAVTPDTILLNVTEFFKVKEVLRDRRPDMVVNCIGMIVQASQDRVDQAILINGYLPHYLCFCL
jgi:dTDP-4-dehydrorhamnose reductase